MTPAELMADLWKMIEEAQQEANQTENPALRRQLLKRRDLLTEIGQRVRALEASRPAWNP